MSWQKSIMMYYQRRSKIRLFSILYLEQCLCLWYDTRMKVCVYLNIRRKILCQLSQQALSDIRLRQLFSQQLPTQELSAVRSSETPARRKRIKQQFSQAKLGRCMAELLQNEWRTQLITGGCAGKNNSTEEQKT